MKIVQAVVDEASIRGYNNAVIEHNGTFYGQRSYLN